MDGAYRSETDQSIITIKDGQIQAAQVVDGNYHNVTGHSMLTIRNGQVVKVEYTNGGGPQCSPGGASATNNSRLSSLMANDDNETPLPIQNWVEDSRNVQQPSAPVQHPSVTYRPQTDTPTLNVGSAGALFRNALGELPLPLPLPTFSGSVDYRIKVLKDAPPPRPARRQANYGQPVIANGGRGVSGDDNETPLPVPNWGAPRQVRR